MFFYYTFVLLFDLLIFSISSVTLKDLKAFLPRIDCKISTNKLREIFQDVDVRKRMELGFDDFTIFYHKLIFNEYVSNKNITNN